MCLLRMRACSWFVTVSIDECVIAAFSQLTYIPVDSVYTCAQSVSCTYMCTFMLPVYTCVCSELNQQKHHVPVSLVLASHSAAALLEAKCCFRLKKRMLLMCNPWNLEELSKKRLTFGAVVFSSMDCLICEYTLFEARLELGIGHS